MLKLGVAANRSFSVPSHVPPTSPKFSQQCGAIDSQLRQTTVNRNIHALAETRPTQQVGLQQATLTVCQDQTCVRRVNESQVFLFRRKQSLGPLKPEHSRYRPQTGGSH